ncbi:MAG: HDIG domain-containing protein [Bacteroidales bacterium]|nr:HDIG domain-containing protein [Bacteroidales bacterium]MBN2819702.1 HDIG domain-containing protein [Bacteroidales bacterium]
MNKVFTKVGNYLKHVLTIILFVASLVVIVYLLPRERKFDLEYSIGSPWKYENLVANFNFSVYKPEAELQAERDSLINNLPLYFYFNGDIFEKNLKSFKENFDKQWVVYSLREFKIDDEKTYYESGRYVSLINLQNKYRDFISSTLEQAYVTGIVREPTASETGIQKIKKVKILRNNIAEAEETSFNSIPTAKSAYLTIGGLILDKIEEDNSRNIQRYSAFFSELDIDKYLVENVIYNAEKTDLERIESEKKISLTKGKIQEGELIIAKGVIVTHETFQILESYKRDYSEQFGQVNSFLAWAGRIILVLIALSVIYLFMFNFRREILNSIVKTSFILFMMVAMLLLARTAYNIENISYYIVPFAILPIIIRTFYDERVALFIHVITILLAGFFADSRFEFVFINIFAGMVAIFSLTNLYHRSRFFLAALFVVMAYSFTYFGLSIIQDGSFTFISWLNFRDFALNGVLILISFLLIYLFEKIFGFLSDTTLMELSDTNQPLLRKLAENAPATFQHSLQVANLAEEAIRHIGGNPMLVRTGALYHDIGKMVDASYFTENQAGGPNPHANKDLKESARIIIDHVIKGMELAKKYNLPEPIANFIVTHHGTSTAKYFYRTYQNENPGKIINAQDFQYPGPKPMTKENAVLMMADSVEAASRSLEKYSLETISELVERIINSQIDEGQFEEADITFRDIKRVKEIFKARLNTIYHARIAYPK